MWKFSARQCVFTRMHLIGPVWRSVPRDSELPHFGDQGCPDHTESGCRAIASADGPIRFAKNRDDVCSLRIRQCAPGRNLTWFVDELGDRCLQRRTLREDNRPLDEVLQLADIARP